MISGDGCGLNFPDICLTIEEKHQPENWPERGSNPLGERHECYPMTTAIVVLPFLPRTKSPLVTWVLTGGSPGDVREEHVT